MKLLYVGDLHIRGTSPRNRKDDYKEVLKLKLREVNELAVTHDVEAILCAGDIFDRYEVSIAVLLEFVQIFRESNKPWYTTAGNHDVPGYNLEAYGRTSLMLLEMLVPNFHVCNDPKIPLFLESPGNLLDFEVQVTFTPFSGRMDRNGYGYSPEVAIAPFKIHVAHGMLLDHEPPFDRFTLVQNVETIADLILTGHDHTGYGIYKRADGKVFVNCGSLTRLAASQAEIERPIQVLLIDVQGKEAQLTLIPLKSAKPGEEVLDRSKIEAENKRQYAMEEFAALIQTNTGEAVLLNIPDIVAAIAKQEAFAPDVIERTLAKIEEMQMQR